jgi:hypothetical protein
MRLNQSSDSFKPSYDSAFQKKRSPIGAIGKLLSKNPKSRLELENLRLYTDKSYNGNMPYQSLDTEKRSEKKMFDPRVSMKNQYE